MRGREIIIVMLVVLLTASPFAAGRAGAEPSDGAWTKLAERSVGTGLETATVEVESSFGGFDRLRLETAGADLFVQELRVYFTGGEMQRVVRDTIIARDARSEAYSIEGGPVPYTTLTLPHGGLV